MKEIVDFKECEINSIKAEIISLKANNTLNITSVVEDNILDVTKSKCNCVNEIDILRD
jgi:hypothetical protein